ncbi:MAG TPA: guanylate kinase [Balneolaceae bacterium]|nr:guanylate kinase [Balneolaceae bacterium]
MSNEKGKVLILVAPSGGGKSTMAERLLKDFDKLHFSVSATTRPPRPGEVEGRDYQFLSDQEFKQKIEEGEFLEWEEVYRGVKYGTLRKTIENELEKGYYVLFDLDVLGALNVKKKFGDRALVIFLAPPSLEVLRQRLIDRGSETDQSLKKRLERAKKEMSYADRFDKTVVNDHLDDTYQQVRQIVENFIKK